MLRSYALWQGGGGTDCLAHLRPHIRSEDHYGMEYVLYHFRIKPPVLHQQPASIMKILILIVC